MIKTYFKQAWMLVSENKLLSILSIAGTALAISIIMVIIILLRAKTADCEPEVYRSRMLYVKWTAIVAKADSAVKSRNMLSLYDVREAFYPLQIPEAVSANYSYGEVLLSVPGMDEEVNCDMMLYTDAAFWRVNAFGFLAGKAYDQATVDAGLKQAVVSESVARALLGGVEQAVGRLIHVNFVTYTVCGVVRDVNKFAEWSYAQVWIPYTTNSELARINPKAWGDGHGGRFRCQILARSRADFPAIRQELTATMHRMNDASPDYYLDIMEQPDDFLHQLLHDMGVGGEPFASVILRYTLIIFVVLLVPGINLFGITQTRLRKRMSEIGVRKAFGGTKNGLIYQILVENFLLTILGGAVGLLFSYLCIGMMSGWLLASSLGGVATMSTSMISPWIFLVALLFCLVLNLLSAGIPAWRIMRTTISHALNEKR